MSAIRTFIAIDLPGSMLDKLDAIIEQLKHDSNGIVRWVPAHNIHLTLKFLGDISPANIQILCTILEAEVRRHSPFEFVVSGLGAFPSSRRPRVIWVGVQAPETLAILHSGIENEARKIGYAPEERPFSPHLTLGRVGHNARPEEIRQLSNSLVNYKVGTLGTVKVDSLCLYRSDLKPGGAVYTPLFRCALQS
jgi:2'-5' RNA ligase